MFSDFLAVCWDIVANEIAKSRYMTNGQVSFPLVIRTANGGGVRFGAQHSQSVENWAMTIPGLKVVAPSTPPTWSGLMAAAIRDPDPVVFFEHKGLMGTKGEVPDGEIVDELGTARIVRAGTDATIVALAADGAPSARGGRAPRAGRHRGRGDRHPLARAARHAHAPRVGGEDRAICSRSRRTRGSAAGAPSSSRSWPRRASGASTVRASASRRRTSRCPRPPRSRTSAMPSVDRIYETVCKALESGGGA